MKRLILSILMIAASCGLMAQEESTIKIPSGYQGSIDHGTSFRLWDGTRTVTAFSTTHGFFFNPHTYIGVGVGLEGGNDYFAMPVYTTLKYVFTVGKSVSPAAQVRVGSYLSDASGAYGDVALGLRFASKRDFAVNVLISGSFLINIEEETITRINGTNTTVESDTRNPSHIGLRIGIEW